MMKFFTQGSFLFCEAIILLPYSNAKVHIIQQLHLWENFVSKKLEKLIDVIVLEHSLLLSITVGVLFRLQG